MSVAGSRTPLPILTTLRFFAATEVVLRHYPLPVQSEFLRDLTSAGYHAVTFFFILSGFILTYVYTGPVEQIQLNVTTREFWKARIARVSPAYFLGLLLLLPRFLYTALISKIQSLDLFILGLVLVPAFQQAWWPPAALLWNAPAWSLSVEFLFYALFPMLVHVTSKWSRYFFLLSAYGLVVAVTIFRSAILPDSALESVGWSNFKWFFPIFHLPQFIFGVALARLYLFGPAISSRIHATMLSVGAIGVVFFFGMHPPLPWWAEGNTSLVPLFSLVILGGARAEMAFKVLTFPAMVLLGESSYSIYILHIPVAFWWEWITRKVLRLGLPAWTDFWLFFALVITVSVLSFLYVETPLRRRILGHREHRAA